jgi:hypothetical protein
MSEKKLNRTRERNEKARKRDIRNTIIFAIVCALIFIGMIVGIVLTSKSQEKKAAEQANTSSGSSSSDLYSVVIDEEQVAAYTNGLNEDGTITGIDNINDYVTLGDYESIVIHDDDFEAETDHGQYVKTESYVIGEYLLDELRYISEVETYEPLYEAIYELNDYIFNARYEKQNEIHESQGLDTWDNIYSFYTMTETEYYYYLEQTSLYDTQYIMICQALAEKLGVTVSDQDMINYCLEETDIAASESQAKDIINQYGVAYIAKETIEWKLKNLLGENAEKVDGSRTDAWTDESENYSAGFYESGKIYGIGDISTYCDFDKENYNSIFESAESAEELVSALMDSTEFSTIDSFKAYYTTILEAASHEADTEYDDYIENCMNYDILIQYLYEDYKIDIDSYVEGYLHENGLDLEAKAGIIYSYGEGYFYRQVMEYSVYEYIDMLIANRG